MREGLLEFHVVNRTRTVFICLIHELLELLLCKIEGETLCVCMYMCIYTVFICLMHELLELFFSQIEGETLHVCVCMRM